MPLLYGRRLVVPGILWLGLLVTCYLIYRPGLSGAFVFDDFPNLTPLGYLGDISGWERVKAFLASGFSGPTGRPVSLLTLLIDAHGWPADAEPFKRTNILIHLLNGTLLFWLVLRLLQVAAVFSGDRKLQAWAALFVAALWMFHPFLVSTTLYVIQRMAQLATLFCLLGMLGYVVVRTHPGLGALQRHVLLTVVLGVTTVLAALSKENGALLPSMILVVEALLLRRCASVPPVSRLWVALFLVLPSLAILFYLVRVPWVTGWNDLYASRDFTPHERLLTQARMVFHYLVDWVVPKAFTSGVYHDDVVISRSLLQPLSTLLALLGVAGLLVSAWLLRVRFVWWSLAVLLYFTSQLVESTTIGLELKFEHRAYLGTAFLYLPVVVLLFQHLSVRIAAGVVIALLAVNGVLANQGARLWGDYPTMIGVWAYKAPDSARAQREYARWLYLTGAKQDGLRVIEAASERMPDQFGLRVTQIMLQCRMSRAQEKDKQDVLALAKDGYYQKSEFNLVNAFLEWAQSEGCRGLDASYYEQVIRAFLAHPRNQNQQSLEYAQLTYFLGRGLLSQGRMQEAEDAFALSLASRREPHKLMSIAAQYARRGDFQRAAGFAYQARDMLVSGNLKGRDAASAPLLSDVDAFIAAVSAAQQDMKQSVNDSWQEQTEPGQ